MPHVTATVPLTAPPSWAVWERRLLDALGDSVHPFLARYCRDDGELIWNDEWGGGSPDDFYEGYFNWPLVYNLGGGDHLLQLADRGWESVTRQLTRLGTVYKEYAAADDQFHESEKDVLFYQLCMADPDGPRRRERAQRFAGFYLNEDPDAINYDPVHKIILSPNGGSRGAYYTPEERRETARAGADQRYGMAFYDLPGIDTVDDLNDPAKARLMGQAMHDRWRRGDSVPNLAVTSLVTNAFILSGEEKYRDWVVEYTGAWLQRARDNDWLIPDSVGHSGQVGEYVGGKWYGGRTGWTMPHGFYSHQMAVLDAATNAFLLTRDRDYLELPRRQMDRICELGEVRNVDDEHMSLPEHWIGQLTALGEQRETFLVPYRYGDAGWFDWQPLSAVFPLALWNVTHAEEDWERIDDLRQAEAYDWREVVSFHNKEDCGHEQPWACFLAGDKPDYPEEILSASYQSMCQRLALIRGDDEVDRGERFHVHRWQETNPVTSEALVQLTLGAPQPIYNGGLLIADLRYFDAERRRPGLPDAVGALVDEVDADRIRVRLVNLDGNAARRLVIQAGAMAEHRFSEARYTVRTSDYPGAIEDYCEPPLRQALDTTAVDGKHLEVELPPATDITIELGLQRFVDDPSYSYPW